MVYVEPYPKSKAADLHDDSITLSDEAPCSGVENQQKVLFQPYVGVGARHFMDFFSMRLGSGQLLVRKNRETSRTVPWAPETGNLRIQMEPFSYLDYEVAAKIRFDWLGKKLKGATNDHS